MSDWPGVVSFLPPPFIAGPDRALCSRGKVGKVGPHGCGPALRRAAPTGGAACARHAGVVRDKQAAAGRGGHGRGRAAARQCRSVADSRAAGAQQAQGRSGQHGGRGEKHAGEVEEWGEGKTKKNRKCEQQTSFALGLFPSKKYNIYMYIFVRIVINRTYRHLML